MGGTWGIWGIWGICTGKLLQVALGDRVGQIGQSDADHAQAGLERAQTDGAVTIYGIMGARQIMQGHFALRKHLLPHVHWETGSDKISPIPF